MQGRLRARALLATLFAVFVLVVPPGLAAQPAAASPYAALGDSYASGPGIPLPEEPYGCHRSTNNYAHLLARARDLALRDASCRGAKTVHMTRPQDVSPGPNPPQFDRLDSDTSLVTLQIGGNEIGFSEIVESCFSSVPSGTPCQDRYVVDGRDELHERIAATAPKIRATIQGIAERAPEAAVLVLGYPTILPDAGPACWPTVPVTPEDAPYLRAKHKELNAMLASAAADMGVRYVDVYTPSIGHDACQPPGVRWVEPAVPASPAAPLHPNLLGMMAMAEMVGNGLRR